MASAERARGGAGVLVTQVRIPISRPSFGAAERDAILKPLDSGWVVQGPCVAEFERKFAVFTGALHAAATTSCTTALHLAIVELGAGPGDEVIVPAFTWISTANVVEYTGATPVFCDIDLATFNVDVDALEAAVTPRTVGIVAVHLFGLCADMPRILDVARRHHVWVVEDAACGFGARIDGRHAGTFGDAGCFSFHPRKAITTGEGGMVTTSSSARDGRIRSLRDHGASRSDFARHTSADGFLLPEYEILGFNYRMTDIQGALGSAQMDRAAAILARRQEIARRYDERLRSCAWLATPQVPRTYDHGYQSYVCTFRPDTPSLDNVERLHARRNALMRRLESEGIATRAGTHAAALTSFYARKYGLSRDRFPRAHIAEQLTISLPIFDRLADEDVDVVCESLKRAVDA